MYCAGSSVATTNSPCQGDTGGPIMCKNDDGNYEIAGITLFAQVSPTRAIFQIICFNSFQFTLGLS